MKDVYYEHSWNSKKTFEEDTKDKFGELLNEEDTADSYEVASSHLYKKDDTYVWLQANGCSCWYGDYSGWELTKQELLTLADKRAQDPDGYYGPDHEKIMALWIKENIK